LFHEVFKRQFRSFFADLRLKAACKLLKEGKLKIIDVALESGYSSLALFNYLFKRKYHVTPSQWRKQYAAPPRRASRRGLRVLQVAAALVSIALPQANLFL
jgi:AraC-like DNA-binding protein